MGHTSERKKLQKRFEKQNSNKTPEIDDLREKLQKQKEEKEERNPNHEGPDYSVLYGK